MARTFLAWTGVLLLCSAIACQRQKPLAVHSAAVETNRTFPVRGVITQIAPGGTNLLVAHDAVTGYMPAMTMPFCVRDPNRIAGLRPGDEIRFRLRVTANESWIDEITQVGTSPALAVNTNLPAPPTNAPVPSIAAIPDFALTNELGARMRWGDFKGKAVAMTFFFTRCPVPEFCPRLSRNFAEASARLAAVPGGPTNWQFLSVSFDPLDTPAVLRQYARHFQSDSNHWQFITGDAAQIRALTQGFGLSVTEQSGTLTHDFRTILFDANGRLHALWPIGGNTTDLLVREMTKAASVPPVLKQPKIDDK